MYEAYYQQLVGVLPAHIKLGPPNQLARGLLVDFPNPLTKRTEKRILDAKLGIFLSFPRLQTFALYFGQKLVFESKREPHLARLISHLETIVRNVSQNKAWNAKPRTS